LDKKNILQMNVLVDVVQNNIAKLSMKIYFKNSHSNSAVERLTKTFLFFCKYFLFFYFFLLKILNNLKLNWTNPISLKIAHKFHASSKTR
jgi:hypothetical protein